MTMSSIEWLQRWLTDQSNEDWEHRFGITITSLDNPGWAVAIDLEETGLERSVFVPINEERSESNWLICRVNDKRFEGFGGPANLGEIIEVFREWSEGTGDTPWISDPAVVS